jgi:putative membrane protein
VSGQLIAQVREAMEGMMRFSNAISDYRTPATRNPWLITMVASFLTLWTCTLLGTSDLSNWLLENALVFLALACLGLTYKRMPFSDLSYLLIFIYLSLHVYGAMHTYAENPLGDWLQHRLHLLRNPYDRIVHFSFGFLLAYPMRELFLVALKWPPWVAWLLPIELTMSISALYELVEWGVADVFFPAQGTAFLGTQGDVWDAQKDILAAFCGAILATSIVSAIKRKFRLE